MAQLAGTDDDDFAKPDAALRDGGKMGRESSAPVKPSTPLDAVSASLRHAYESTLEEAIPDSFMDLLNKLD